MPIEKVSYYEDFNEIEKKLWSLLERAVNDRNSEFRTPVFICGNKNNVDGRVIVLRKADSKNNGSLLPITEVVDKYYGEVQEMGGNRWDTSSLIRRLSK